MPLSTSKTSDSDFFVGSKTMMKWKGKKWNEVQILKISGMFTWTWFSSSVSESL